MSTTLVSQARRGGLVLQLVFVVAAQAKALLASAAVAGLLLLAWECCYAGGGSRTAWPHAFYLAIVLAGVRFAWRGAATVAVSAGLLAGPFMPADTTLGTTQPWQEWLLRMAAYATIGLFVAALMRNQAVSPNAALQDSMTAARLIRAIRRHEIEVYYQPICDLRTGRVSGVEGLARWHDARRGLLHPGQFVPAAERTGVIAVLDDYVLRVATAQAQH